MQTGARFLDLLVPRVCASCGVSIAPGAGELCEACAWELSALVSGAYCCTCGEDRGPHLLLDGRCTACRQGKQALRFDHFIRAGRYGGALQRLILRFKREFVLDHFLGGLLADAVRGRLDPRNVDYWVPIPSHWWRRLRRGYQPTQLLARAVAREAGPRVAPILVATRNVPPFHHRMSATERVEAISGAFRVTRACGVAGKRICLIDDVTTTGATLAEARRVLRRAGAVSVAAAGLAKVSRLPPIPQGVDPLAGAP
jgi:ComF family protein